MKEYDFALNFKFSNPEINPEIYLDALYEAGLSDAVFGIGEKGGISVDIIRESESAYDAIYSAIEQVKSVIPDANLTHVSPDIVGVRDLAEIFECTRQNIQKFVSKRDFPEPLYKNSQAIWYLRTVLRWFTQNSDKKINQEMIDVAELAREINLSLEKKLSNPELSDSAEQLVII